MNMNLKRLLSTGVIVGMSWLACHTSAAAPSPRTTGTIAFYYPDGSAQCSYPIATGEHLFYDQNCRSLADGSTFQLRNAPSATRITFKNRISSGTVYATTEILTIKEPTTTDKIVIADLRTLPPGRVAAPGVRFTHYWSAPSAPSQSITQLIIDVSPEQAATLAEPKLTLAGANGANHCTLEFKTAEYRFEDGDPCKNDEAVGIELEHAPSASNILLTDDDAVSGTPGCTTDNPGNYFWIMLRTIKEDVSVPPIDLDDIIATPRGSVVAPGVQVIDYYQNPAGSTPKRRTSCVKIEVDAPVPSVPLPRP
ncbi:putative uncharacterized protein [Pseudomonas sp. StFLB209]|uniref:hypothetical protein n=1 Tax=Pseudomonas sp. StFLB209 TaxID=1028989 RepID=UPI0004F73D78|nr:hypothetical protein [Pseudomonas sp. StFLB209]BAP44566.1 putative uncharacterized protein [Pseudomonas sp. StFLB209]